MCMWLVHDLEIFQGKICLSNLPILICQLSVIPSKLISSNFCGIHLISLYKTIGSR